MTQYREFLTRKVSEGADGEPLSINDCACGAGVMLLAARAVAADAAEGTPT